MSPQAPPRPLKVPSKSPQITKILKKAGRTVEGRCKKVRVSAGDLPDELNLVVEDVAEDVPMDDEAQESISLEGEETEDASADDEPVEEAPVESGAE